MKKKVGVVLTLSVIIGGFIALPNEISDRINPLVPKKVVFVQINESGAPRSPAGYDYTLTGFTEDGEETVVTFYAGRELKKNAYLKVYAKGSYIETWEEVQPEALPEKVKVNFTK
ncbi:YxeA family protein [Bacillus sp. FJAT-53060]|uniref:YxeA family protein n=1 Tax=Bacillus sp. FJAT-53060 TaxID=3127666 RepID=UPI0030132FB7